MANNFNTTGGFSHEIRLYTLGWDHGFLDDDDERVVRTFTEEKAILSIDFGKKGEFIVYSVKGTQLGATGYTRRIKVDNLSTYSPQQVRPEAYRVRSAGRKFSGSSFIVPTGRTTLLLPLTPTYTSYREYQNPQSNTTTTLINLNIDQNEYAMNTTARQSLRIADLEHELSTRKLGDKHYELTDHLGNVRHVFTDRKLAGVAAGDNQGDYDTEMVSATDYYPFGMMMPGRNYSSDDYRYGFQGQEKDDEIKGAGNSVNYKYRMHDPRLGRFFAVDPLAYSYPWNSPYAFSENRVIDGIELEGLEFSKAVNGRQGVDWFPIQVETAKSLFKKFEGQAINASGMMPFFTPPDDNGNVEAYLQSPVHTPVELKTPIGLANPNLTSHIESKEKNNTFLMNTIQETVAESFAEDGQGFQDVTSIFLQVNREVYDWVNSDAFRDQIQEAFPNAEFTVGEEYSETTNTLIVVKGTTYEATPESFSYGTVLDPEKYVDQGIVAPQ